MLEKTTFGAIETGSHFIHDNWLHLKLNSDTFIAVDYAGSNGMEDDEPVTSVDIESLIKGSNNTCRSLT